MKDVVEEGVESRRTRLANIFPKLHGFKLVGRRTNRFNLFCLSFSIEWCHTTKEKVGDDSDRPNVDGFAVAGFAKDLRKGRVSGRCRTQKRVNSRPRVPCMLERRRGSVSGVKKLEQRATTAPGVPQTVLSTVLVDSSIISLNPKSATMSSASSSSFLNSRFSGFKSVVRLV